MHASIPPSLFGRSLVTYTSLFMPFTNQEEKNTAVFVSKQASGQPGIQAQITSLAQKSSTITSLAQKSSTNLFSTICSKNVEATAEIMSQCMLAIVPPGSLT
jgi:hypothetical protein